MDVLFAQGRIPTMDKPSIFLAGPTPRNEADQHLFGWRKDALNQLEKIRKFDGYVFVPEFEDWTFDDKQFDYNAQIEWEHRALRYADCILFWIPRVITEMPAFTTNDEFGYWKSSGKVVAGFPPSAKKVRYQKYYIDRFNIPFSQNLNSLTLAAYTMAYTNYRAKNGEVRYV